jgi:hypothetical protein
MTHAYHPRAQLTHVRRPAPTVLDTEIQLAREVDGDGLRRVGVVCARSLGVSWSFSSWNRSILAEIYLCHACSRQEILRTKTAGQAPLHTARCAEVAAALVRLGADVHARAEFGCTPLHRARDAGTVAALLAAGASVSACNHHRKWIEM